MDREIRDLKRRCLGYLVGMAFATACCLFNAIVMGDMMLLWLVSGVAIGMTFSYGVVIWIGYKLDETE